MLKRNHQHEVHWHIGLYSLLERGFNVEISEDDQVSWTLQGFDLDFTDRNRKCDKNYKNDGNWPATRIKVNEALRHNYWPGVTFKRPRHHVLPIRS
jgi:hypothetical protein